jgi:hypothetical protein
MRIALTLFMLLHFLDVFVTGIRLRADRSEAHPAAPVIAGADLRRLWLFRLRTAALCVLIALRRRRGAAPLPDT